MKFFELAVNLISPRGETIKTVPSVFDVRGVGSGRFTIKVTVHTPWCENRCATVFTSLSPLERGGMTLSTSSCHANHAIPSPIRAANSFSYYSYRIPDIGWKPFLPFRWDHQNGQVWVAVDNRSVERHPQPHPSTGTSWKAAICIHKPTRCKTSCAAWARKRIRGRKWTRNQAH